MILRDLEFQDINVFVFKTEVLQEVDDVEPTTEQEAAEALTQLYDEADSVLKAFLFNETYVIASKTKENSIAIGNFWEKLRHYVCSVLRAVYTREELLEAILQFIAKYIPGAIVIKPLVKRILKYLLGLAYDSLCPAVFIKL